LGQVNNEFSCFVSLAVDMVPGMITKRQRDLLNFVERYIKRRGFCPSYSEMAEGLNLKSSKSGIHRMIVGLEERGFIKRLPNRARAIEIVRQPQ
jgi:repressor LexA